jgi:hypothetical protein
LFQENDSLWIGYVPVGTAASENHGQSNGSKLYGTFVSCKKIREEKVRIHENGHRRQSQDPNGSSQRRSR